MLKLSKMKLFSPQNLPKRDLMVGLTVKTIGAIFTDEFKINLLDGL